MLDGIFKALSYLVIASIVGYTYSLAKNSTQTRNSTLLKGLLWCSGFALVSSLLLGDPSCIEQDDPIYGGCLIYADNGYEPTMEQRLGKFVYYMTLLYIPVVFGAFSKSKS